MASKIIRIAAIGLLIWGLALGLGADAQGLVGAPHGGCSMNQSDEVGPLADYSYDTARDIARIATALSVVPSALLGIWFVRKKRLKVWPSYRGCLAHRISDHPSFQPKQAHWSRPLVSMLIGLGIPTIVHLVGTFAINNMGGLSGP